MGESSNSPAGEGGGEAATVEEREEDEEVVFCVDVPGVSREEEEEEGERGLGVGVEGLTLLKGLEELLSVDAVCAEVSKNSRLSDLGFCCSCCCCFFASSSSCAF